MEKVRLFILGVPGSGKGTVSKLLLEALGSDVRYYNVGGILRERAEQDKHIKDTHAAGGLVDSNRVLSIFDEALTQNQYIVDGSPRKLEEAKYILYHPKWLASPGLLIHLDLAKSVAKRRLIQRARFDDTSETIDKRFANYFNDTAKSIALFKNHDRCITVDANAASQTVCNTILKALEDIK